MPDTRDTRADARAELFDKLRDVRAGMLGVKGHSGHMRPMSHFADAEEAVIWFITSRKTDLATDVGQGSTAHYCVVDDGDGFYACVNGPILPYDDSAKLDDLWNVVAAAWFEGRDDPDLMLLKMSLAEAEVWRSTDSGFHFGLEIARANMNPDKEPDVGSHDRLTF